MNKKETKSTTANKTVKTAVDVKTVAADSTVKPKTTTSAKTKK